MSIKLTKLLNQNGFAIGVFSIIICLVTWGLDLSEIVIQCPYCRVQRTMIGILGIMAILPKHRNGLLRYGAYFLAFFGADISVDQMFISIKSGYFPTVNALLAMSAFVIIGILTIINHYRYLKPVNKAA